MLKRLTSLFLLILVCALFLSSCDNVNSQSINIPDETNNSTSNESTSNQDNMDKTTSQDVYFDVVFKDYNNIILETQRVKKGDIPSYSKSNPTRENDENNQYIFSGWNPEISAATCNITYVAQYTKTDLPYTISFDLDGGTSKSGVSSIKIDKLTKDRFKFDILKDKYIFKGWSCNGVQVFDNTGNIINNIILQPNMTFKAMFEESIKLTITYSFYNPKTSSKIKTLYEKPADMGNVSETRTYNWNTPVDLVAKPNEGYTFIGWYHNGLSLSNEENYNYDVGR